LSHGLGPRNRQRPRRYLTRHDFEVVAWLRHDTIPIGPAPWEPEKRVTAQERAASLRDEAYEACAGWPWALCERKLDEAKAMDPAGESDARVEGARQAVDKGLMRDAGREDDKRGAEGAEVNPARLNRGASRRDRSQASNTADPQQATMPARAPTQKAPCQLVQPLCPAPMLTVIIGPRERRRWTRRQKATWCSKPNRR
jgi:hypothetical protein